MKAVVLVLVLLGALALLLGGCVISSARRPRPGRTKLGAPLVIVPAATVGNYLIVETKWDKHGPYHFLVDTGSSTTLVTPELAAAIRQKTNRPKPPRAFASAPPTAAPRCSRPPRSGGSSSATRASRMSARSSLIAKSSPRISA
jgi:hypothetical protein